MQRRITQTAMYYISQNNVCDYDLRFDVVTVSPTFLGFNHIEHLDNAWEASA
jgi:Holliday junction resolvase-like predicted endonuclease